MDTNDSIRRVLEVIRIFTQPAIAVGLLKRDELEEVLGRVVVGEDRLITFSDAAEQLSVSTRTVARMLNSGELSGKRLRAHHKNTMRIFQSSVNEVLRPPATGGAPLQ